VLAISSQHGDVLAAVIYFSLRTFVAVPFVYRILTTLASSWLYFLVAGASPSAIRAGVVATIVLAAGLLGRQSSRPCDSRTYNGLKVRFSATLREEPEARRRSLQFVGDVRDEVAPDLVDPPHLVGADVVGVLASLEHGAPYSAPTPARLFASKR
jgi:hypothetical protein